MRGPVISVTALLQQLQWPSLADRQAHSILQCPHRKDQYSIVQPSG